MIDTSMIVSLLGVSACFVLALRAYRSHGNSFEKSATMVVAWVLIVAILAFALNRMGLSSRF